MNIAQRRQDVLLLVLSALIGALWFLCRGGAGYLDPDATASMMQGDWAQHILGWMHFRNVAWRLPLGDLPSVAAPVGTTLGYVDGGTLLGLLFKPWADVLPPDFQYVGITLLLCFTLQGGFGFRLSRRISERWEQRLLIAALFVASPLLLHRTGHENLCAHFLLLWALDVALDEDASRAKELVIATALATMIHPYLLAFVVPVAFAWLYTEVKVRKAQPWTWARRQGIAILLTFALTAFAFGYFTGASDIGGGGYGIYSTDLLSLVNAMGHSRLLPRLPAGEGQYEGFGYLGLGALALISVACALCGSREQRDRVARVARLHWPLLLAVAGLTALAISTRITIAGHPVLEIPLIARNDVMRTFRASGRFVWMLHYAVLLFACAVVCTRLPRTWAAMALLGALALQTYDTSHIVFTPKLEARAPLDGIWRDVDGYRRIDVIPPDIRPACDSAWPKDAWLTWGYYAYRAKLAINSAYLARSKREALEAYCARATAQFLTAPEDDVVYVVSPSVKDRPARMVCAQLAGDEVCVTGTQKAFARALAARAGR